MKFRILPSQAACAATLSFGFVLSTRAADVVSTWSAAASATWADNANWNNTPGPDVFPSNDGVTTYDAVIDAMGAPFTVALASDITVEDLTINSADATLELQSGNLTANGGITLTSGLLYFNGGGVVGTTITPGGGSVLFSGNGNNRLDGATFTGDLLLNQAAAHHVVRMQNGGTFSGNATLGTPDGYQGILGYEQTGTLNGKTLNFDPSYSGGAVLSIDGDNTLTFGPALIARGAANIGQAYFVGGTSTLVNQGLISSDLAGLTTTVNPTFFTNEGIAEAINDATLTIQPATSWSNAATGTIRAVGAGSVLNFYGSYTNAGDIELTDSTLNLHGTFTTTGLGIGSFTRSGTSVVNIIGDMDNTGNTFALDATTGDWTMQGGRIIGGSVTETGGAKLLFSGNSVNRLEGVTFTGALLLNQPGVHQYVRLQNGTTFSGNATLGTPDGYQGILSYEQTGTLNAKTLNFDPSYSGGGILAIEGDNTLTLGPTLVARGAGNIGQGVFVGGTSTLVNQGLISSDLTGLTTTVNPTFFTNEGIAEAINDATLTILPGTSWSNAATGTIRAVGAGSVLNFYGSYTNAGDIELTDSTLNLHGTFTTTGLGIGSFTRSGTSVVNIIGDMDNTGNTFALDATTGDWTMQGGRIIGGSVTETGGAKLLFSGNSVNRLDGVTFTGALLLNQPGVHQYVRLQNGTTFSGNATLGTPDGYQGILSYEQTGTLNAKTLNFDPSYSGGGILAIEGDNTLTLGPTLVARGAGNIGQAVFLGGTSTLVNQGLISSDLGGLTTTINPSIFTNEGVAAAINGATLTIQPGTSWTNEATATIRATGAGSTLNFYGSYTNAGDIELTDSTLNLHGTFTTTGLGIGSFTRSGTSVVNIIGDMDNTGNTFALNATTGDWHLAGGRILGGQITQSGGSRVLFDYNGGNRLDGVALQDELDLTEDGGSFLRLENGATFLGNANLGTTTGNTSILAYNQTGTLGARILNMDPVFGNAYLSIEGDNVLTFGPDLIARGAGQIGSQFVIGGTSGLVNQGLISADIPGQTLSLAGIVNLTSTGTVQATGGGTMFINNPLTNLSAGILTGGGWRSFADSTLWFYNDSFAANWADITLSGANSQIWLTSAQTPLEDLLTSTIVGGALRILGGRDYTTTVSFSNGGSLELGGGTFTASSLSNTNFGNLFGFGTVAVRPINTGNISAVGGTLAFTDGLQGSTGTVGVNVGSTLDVSAGLSTGSSASGLLLSGNLALGTKTFSVSLDYTNSNFGTGNTFSPRANVTGTGAILAVGGTGQTLSGNVTGGGSASPTMAFGKVHVGHSSTLNYQINNTGASGSRLRGAIQTSINGGNLTDARLSGSGVTAANFGAIVPGGNSGILPVTFTATTAGALTGQTVRLLNNFDNVTDQTLAITGTAYRYAAPSNHSPAPVNFGNFHVGHAPLPSQVLTLSNTAANDGFSESLNASIGGATGGVTTNGGSFTALTPGSSNGSSLSVGIGTGSAGSKNGTATINLTSNGSGSSDLGLTALSSQTVTVTGAVYRYAAPVLPGGTSLDFGIVHVGDVAQQTVGVSNSVPNDGFSESLDGSFSGSSGHLSGAGSFTSLAPGSSTTAPVVTLDTATAGSKAGTTTLALVSNGSGSSGLGNTTLAPQVIIASGQVNHFAAPVFTKDSGAAGFSGGGTAYTVDFGRRTIGEPAPSVTLRLTNSAAAPSDTLAGSFVSAAPDFTLSGFGSFSNVAAGQSRTNLVVSLQTDTLGTFSQTITLNGLSENPGGYSGALAPITITLTGEVAVVPQLKIQLVGTDAVLSWPLAEQSWVLKKGSNLTGWSNVTEPVIDTATEHTVTTPRGANPNLFFRLEK